MSIFKRKQQPENINDLSNHHMMQALVTHFMAEGESDKGTVASHHLREISQKHLHISNVLDSVLEANEKAGQG